MHPFLSSSPLPPTHPPTPLLLFSESIPLLNHLHSSLYLSLFFWGIWLKTREYWCWLLVGICWEVKSTGDHVAGAVECGRKWTCLHSTTQWWSCRTAHLGTWISSDCHKEKPTLSTTRMMDWEQPSAAVMHQGHTNVMKWRRMWLPHTFTQVLPMETDISPWCCSEMRTQKPVETEVGWVGSERKTLGWERVLERELSCN